MLRIRVCWTVSLLLPVWWTVTLLLLSALLRVLVGGGLARVRLLVVLLLTVAAEMNRQTVFRNMVV